MLKYAPPTSETESDQLYHVVWEDGDEQDYDEEDLQKGIQLYHETYENGGGGRSGNRSSSSSGSSSAKNTPVKKQEEEEEVEEVEVVEKKTKKEEQREKEEEQDDDEVEIVEPPPRSRNRSGSHSQTTSSSSSSSSSSSGYKPEPTSGTKRQRGSGEDSSPVKSKPAAAPSSSAKKAKTTAAAAAGKSSTDNDEPVWVTMHSVIGTKVCAYFPCASNDPDGVYPPSKRNAKGKKFKPYDGEVTKFAYESAPGENDQLYHVVWEDGDEEDLFQAEFDEAKELFVNLNWHRERGHFGKK